MAGEIWMWVYCWTMTVSNFLTLLISLPDCSILNDKFLGCFIKRCHCKIFGVMGLGINREN